MTQPSSGGRWLLNAKTGRLTKAGKTPVADDSKPAEQSESAPQAPQARKGK